MGFLGGLGTLSGPIIGALILEPTQRYFTMQFSASGYYLIIYGALFLAIILLLPEGIVPTLNRYWLKWNVVRSGSIVEDEQTKYPQEVNPGAQAQRENEVKP